MKPYVNIYEKYMTKINSNEKRERFSQIAIVIEQPKEIRKDENKKFYWQLRTHKGKVITEGYTKVKRNGFDSAKRRFNTEFKKYCEENNYEEENA